MTAGVFIPNTLTRMLMGNIAHTERPDWIISIVAIFLKPGFMRGALLKPVFMPSIVRYATGKAIP